jgi:hypothetical protein
MPIPSPPIVGTPEPEPGSVLAVCVPVALVLPPVLPVPAAEFPAPVVPAPVPAASLAAIPAAVWPPLEAFPGARIVEPSPSASPRVAQFRVGSPLHGATPEFSATVCVCASAWLGIKMACATNMQMTANCAIPRSFRSLLAVLIAHPNSVSRTDLVFSARCFARVF